MTIHWLAGGAPVGLTTGSGRKVAVGARGLVAVTLGTSVGISTDWSAVGDSVGGTAAMLGNTDGGTGALLCVGVAMLPPILQAAPARNRPSTAPKTRRHDVMK